MSSNITPSSATATATEWVALTTPYEPPLSCQSNWKRTTVAWTQDGSSAVLALVSEPISTCYPSGWDDTEAGSRFSFSPAVCPSGWVYWKMARETDSSPATSTAYCCESGYTFDWFGGAQQLASTLVPNQCARWVKSTTGMSDEDGTITATASDIEQNDSVITPDGTLMVHQAWAISWAASDTAHLSPQPPALYSGETVASWDPHESVPSDRPVEEPVNDHVNMYISNSAVWFLMVGLPIIAVLLISSCCWCCIRNRRKEKRRRQAAAMDSITPEAGIEHSSVKPIS
ncbi:hypothetical protein FALBO_1917 [Fusarium albosuccineum]|uniref:Uncharacterized protein n=1 Tax=Fusarium albosuccineum TaxID=1237068 RepID=A0A8H4LPF3_9HYPO|nr:hypothetical protein FALBO_1917 [Fusarium albosuccineum]